MGLSDDLHSISRLVGDAVEQLAKLVQRGPAGAHGVGKAGTGRKHGVGRNGGERSEPSGDKVRNNSA